MSQPHAKRLRGATTSATSATSEPPALVYIFLDIDGVLNCWPSRIAAERLPGEAEQALALAGAPSLLARLKLIIERTGAQIVLSSTWRIDSTAIVEERLRSVGLSLLGATPQLSEEEPGDEHFALTQGPDGQFSPELERSIEISRWLARQQVACAAFVALDDMDLVGMAGSRLTSRDHLVQTDDNLGLTRLDAEAAVAKLLLQRSRYHARQLRPQGAAVGAAVGDRGGRVVDGEPASASSSSAAAAAADDDDDDDACLCASPRFDFRSPARRRDAAVLQLFNDESTMLPNLPMLCPMSAAAMACRRDAHRKARVDRSAEFMDIIDRASGALIGTAGFRSVGKDGRAEFGIVVRREWQRRGVCCEAFVANAVYAWSELRCRVITASTLELNGPMRAFCARAGLRLVAKKADHGREWWVHESTIEKLSWPALHSAPAKGVSTDPPGEEGFSCRRAREEAHPPTHTAAL
jgi:RimJ/RimL family protein N-acetyltransferase